MTKKFLAREVSSFQKMILKDYLYIDKTKRIYDLYEQQDQYHFLSRPRRFGKSLLISTLYELFSGNKDLFKDLWIYESNFAFNKNTIIDIDFSTIAHSTSQALKTSLIRRLIAIAQTYNITLAATDEIKDIVSELVPKLAQINEVVLLVDEYDHPMSSYVSGDVTIALKNQELLKEFYDAIKGQDKYLRAAFVTGVTKFSRTSIFSGFLNDISDKTHFADLCLL